MYKSTQLNISVRKWTYVKASTRLLSARPKTKVFWMKCHSSHCKDFNPCREKPFEKCAENKQTKKWCSYECNLMKPTFREKVLRKSSSFNFQFDMLANKSFCYIQSVTRFFHFSPACRNHLKHVLRFSKQMFNKSVSNAKAVESWFLITNDSLKWKS